MKKTVLIVDDSSYSRKVISLALSKAGYDIIGEAESGEAAIDMAIEMNPDIITLDNILPDMMGLDILKIIKEENLKAQVIMISAIGQQSTVADGLKLGALKYIVKPFTANDVIDAVQKVPA
ncbi:response regulator [Reichenbachiella ulvae]|uniref:Response regulator n=1 Tax=Reichenbachiella ulvae TaxID=2980104 RepID=A0ABT3CPJ8_9BACT|nr:response regulator [Reichenbachiella ulvae]MCV9385198.1 response regulator [Reichenbachiella ulvae]